MGAEGQGCGGRSGRAWKGEPGAGSDQGGPCVVGVGGLHSSDLETAGVAELNTRGGWAGVGAGVWPPGGQGLGSGSDSAPSLARCGQFARFHRPAWWSGVWFSSFVDPGIAAPLPAGDRAAPGKLQTASSPLLPSCRHRLPRQRPAPLRSGQSLLRVRLPARRPRLQAPCSLRGEKLRPAGACDKPPAPPPAGRCAVPAVFFTSEKTVKLAIPGRLGLKSSLSRAVRGDSRPSRASFPAWILPRPLAVCPFCVTRRRGGAATAPLELRGRQEPRQRELRAEEADGEPGAGSVGTWAGEQQRARVPGRCPGTRPEP